jgi:RNA polymerase sigma-70 factor (ECF subfamily)
VEPSPAPNPPQRPAAARTPALSDAALAARAERNDALAALLRCAAAGDARAFEGFYDATVGYAHALLRRMLRPADVQDVLADTFFQAWREAARFDAGRGGAVTWLLTLARSRALDLLRHQRASPEVEAGDDPVEATAPTPGPDDLLASMQTDTRLRGALAGLSSNERWVLGLAYYRDLSHREISAETGLPLGTVKSLILRAQGKLREQLATD